MQVFLIYAVVTIVGIIIYTSISRAIFRVDEHIENQEIMIQLLGQMLLKNGFTEEEVRKIINPKPKVKGRFW